MSSPALEVIGLTVRAGGRCLVNVERFSADSGTITAVMGPNGSGKTTLLRACLGLVRPSQGRITVLGEDILALRGTALAAIRRRIGYVPQLLPARGELPITVREVVAIGRTARAGLCQRLSRHDWATVDRWLAELGLDALADRTFGEISGGEQRKTLIARAMAQEPEMLLLDEPTANLDLGWRERMVEALQALFARTRLTVVLVCHELEVLPPACRRVILLEGGQLSATGSPEEVFTTECVHRLYGANLHALHCGQRHAVVPGEEARHA